MENDILITKIEDLIKQKNADIDPYDYMISQEHISDNAKMALIQAKNRDREARFWLEEALKTL